MLSMATDVSHLIEVQIRAYQDIPFSNDRKDHVTSQYISTVRISASDKSSRNELDSWLQSEIMRCKISPA